MAKTILQNIFGYSDFRPVQKEIIDNVISQKNSLALMPTGAGKSLCFQIPALKFGGLTVVISPLISLMKDQVDALQSNGVESFFLNSTLKQNEVLEIENKIKNGEVKILYIAPERLALEYFQDFLKGLEKNNGIQISLFAIDEAHCISEWGHDFRPDYKILQNLKIWFPQTPIIALTATATKPVQKDILKQLKIEDAKVFISSFQRKNLKMKVVQKKEAFPKLLNIMQNYKGESAIIYCFSRKETEKISEKLNLEGFKSLTYHAGLSADKRKKNQDLFIKDEVQIMVATIAFGMGIDKPDVRLVVHYTYPKSLENYYQEAGRAGRDGLDSECILFYTYADTRMHEFFLNGKDKEEADNSRKKIRSVINYAQNTNCRTQFLLEYFGENFAGNCGHCDNCLGEKDDFVILKKVKSSTLNYNLELFEKLRSLRKMIADKKNVPPFVIFADSSLQEMAFYFPQTLDNFGKISGVGKQKLEIYGKFFLKQITIFSSQKNLKEIEIPFSKIEKSSNFGVKKTGGNYQKTKEMVGKKMSISEIAKIQGFKKGTIFNHIEKLVEIGEELDLDYLKPKKDIFEIIKKSFEKNGIELLAPIFKDLKEKYSYDEIRFVRIILNSENK